MNSLQDFQQIIAVAIILIVFVTMQVRRNAPTDLLFGLALVAYILFGIVDPATAWKGFSSNAVIAIGGLLVVSTALRNTGALDSLGAKLLGNVKTERGALGRLSSVLLTSSAFLLNTAIVAMLMPVVISWCRQRNVSPSRLLLPVSYLAILGGTCTLVGTSTNFVVNEKLTEMSQLIEQSERNQALGKPSESPFDIDWLLEQREQLQPMSLFEISRIGVPCALLGAFVLIVCGRRLLPNRTELLDSLEEQRREYLVEMLVTQSCGLIGKTVEEGGLRHLPGLFLIEIDRDSKAIAPVSPSDRILENDRLVFTGVVATIVDLEKIAGLIPATDINYEIAPEKVENRTLVEVVLSPSSPLVGSTIRQANFRQYYGAAVVAVHRNGERLPTKLGDIELSPGDTLLLQTNRSFVRSYRNRPDFYLVSGVEDSKGRRHDRLLLACSLAIGLIAWLLLQSVLGETSLPQAFSSPEVAIFGIALAMVVTGCVSMSDARRSIDLPMLFTVGAAIGVGTGFSQCGAAESIAELLLGFIGTNEYMVLIALFVVTVCLTEMISNVAVATMMFYIAIGVASALDANPRTFIMAITLGASLSFVSPIGYQTNLMVMGPGGYRPTDYLRAGIPLSLAIGALAIILLPLIWPFH
ncbi:SLC13 family permease [Aureliella helgolandensis]|uniref:Citrate transporter n=1 Tax=Aureliella helgolandensis TaxID=2527968 RepID=A0A518G792_9BACT|nr:SLC13 family permease [Aureliella helgolandensis]QDV24453.1 Citrate transporter [Aureliella helgolandensis]